VDGKTVLEKVSVDSLNVQAVGESGELEPFLSAHNAKYVGFLMSYQFRRGNARMGAVNYGTAHTVATPVTSREVQELALYYNFLLEQAERDKQSEELYEAMTLRQLNIDNWIEELRVDDLSEDERRELLIRIDKALIEMEEMSAQMEKLSDA
jgi:hypothetical protein